MKLNNRKSNRLIISYIDDLLYKNTNMNDLVKITDLKPKENSNIFTENITENYDKIDIEKGTLTEPELRAIVINNKITPGNQKTKISKNNQKLCTACICIAIIGLALRYIYGLWAYVQKQLGK